MDLIHKLEEAGVLNFRIKCSLTSTQRPQKKLIYFNQILKRKKLLMTLYELCQQSNHPFKYNLYKQLKNLDELSDITLQNDINEAKLNDKLAKGDTLKNVAGKNDADTIFLKSSTLKGEDLERRMKGQPKKKLSKREAEKKKLSRNNNYWQPVLYTGMTQ